MYNILTNDVDSVASVTPQGIRFRNINYSCSIAISQQWFSSGNPLFILKIPVIYSENTSVIHLILENGELVPAYILPSINNPSQDDLDTYFQKINQLKLDIKILR
jgi:hypothetical protein